MKTLVCAAAAIALCASCIESSTQLGGNLIPLGQQYDFHTVEVPLEEISIRMADSLSGYSSTRITVGAVKDADYGLSTRTSAFALIPLLSEDFSFGKDPEFQSFHFSAARDTSSAVREDQMRIMQNLRVYELAKPLDSKTDFDCNKPVEHLGKNISKRTIIYNGNDSLSFNFTKEYGSKYLSMTSEDLKDIDTYLKKFPGIYIESDVPSGEGGRINIFDLQLNYNSDYGYISGNYAKLRFSAEYDGERRDTSVLFYYGATDFFDLDSLFTSSATGKFPQYSLNLTTHGTRDFSGKAEEKIYVQGGGGLKPMVAAKYVKGLAEEIISEYGDPKDAVINKATLVFPFEFPQDYKDMTHWPQILSPTCRIKGEESTSFMGLTDASSEDEDQGDINRSLLQFSPDITYHLQEILKIDESDAENYKTKQLDNGSYDIWLLIMANEIITTVNSGSQDLSEYYNYLAYQSYYNDMYGGYGGGYGGYNNYYSNYYSYAMMAAYASQSTSQQSISVQLDKDRYYNAVLNGPKHPGGRVPTLRLTFALPKE